MQYSAEVVEKGLAIMAEVGLTELHRLLLGLVPRGSRVLEVGCASGYLSRALREQLGCTVTGVEIVPRLAELAVGNVERVIVGSIDQPEVLAQIGQGYEVLIMADVIEHLEDPWASIGRLKGCMAPGALWFITFPNIAHCQMRWQLLRGRWEYTDFGLLDRTHLRFFSLPSVLSFVQEVGFELVKLHLSHTDYPGRERLLRLPGWRGVDAWLQRRYPNLVGSHFLVEVTVP